MSLYIREGSPFWQYDFTVNGVRFRGSTGEKAKREARKVENELEAKAQKGEVKKEQWTLKVLLASYWENHGKDQRAADTILHHLDALEAGIGGNRRLMSIDHGVLEAYRKARRSDGLQHHSINREIVILRAAMNRASNLHKVAVPDIDWKAMRKPEPPHRERYLSIEEIKALLDAAHESLEPIIACAVSTGLRKSNILEMDWRQVRLKEKRINVVTKGGKVHEVWITPMLLPYLFSMQKREGRVFDSTNFAKRWIAAREAIGLEDFRFHDLRHTFASLARQSGADIAFIMEALGHSDISTSMRYAHIKPDSQDTAFDRVSNAFMSHSASHSLQKREN